MRILIVDDDQGVLNALKANLISFGHTVFVTEDGHRALEVIETPSEGSEPVDLLVTDLKMPFISGLELIHLAKRVDPSLPCVLVTAYGNKGIRKEVESIGSCRYIEKPLRPEDLVEVITKLKS